MTGRGEKSAGYVARTRPVVPPIYQSATFFLDDLAYKDIQEGGGLREHWYSRFANPTVDATAAEIQRRMVTFGGCLDPHAAFLVWRGLQTFDVRLERSSATARKLAARLSDHPEIVSVRYPGLAGNPGGVMKPGRAGAMVACTVRGGNERALAVMRRLRIASEATSLGGVETLVSAPFNSSHFSLGEDELVAARIDAGMLRFSCGLEDAEVLVSDVERALDETT
jgi:cystathionine beta-lyase/cystathionine gamma-synthase